MFDGNFGISSACKRNHLREYAMSIRALFAREVLV